MDTPRSKKKPAPRSTATPENTPADPTPDTADSADAQRAWNDVRPQLTALPEASVHAPTVDVFAATDRVRQLHGQWMRDDALVARFRKVADLGEFDLAHLTELSTRCLAASHGRLLATKARSASFAKVPKATVAKATEVSERMKALAKYLFAKHPDEAKKVAEILQGSGYHDLADDLRELAALYRRHADYVAKDPLNYRATDVADAERLTREIVAALGHDPVQARAEAADMAARAWTLFWRAWSEVSQLGRWLLRESPERAATLFPMLLGELRASSQPGEAAAPPPADAPTPTSGTAPATPKKTSKKKGRGR